MIKTAVAGVGTIGAAVCRALIDGIDGFTLTAASSLNPEDSRQMINRPDFDLPFLANEDLAAHADWIVEALPIAAVPLLARQTMGVGKTLILISSAALLLHPELISLPARKGGRILVPSGALAGMDGINALAEQGIRSAQLTTTKPPLAYSGAPYIIKKNIDLSEIERPTTLFSGNALQAAAAFPANVNVAATLTLASRLPPANVKVEVRADPAAITNRHDMRIEGKLSTLSFTIENRPDPANPKSSAVAAFSIIAALRRESSGFWIG